MKVYRRTKTVFFTFAYPVLWLFTFNHIMKLIDVEQWGYSSDV